MIKSMKKIVKRFEIITVFPDAFKGYLSGSVIGRAIKHGLIQVGVTNIREYTADKHRKVDDRVYGGGPGMVIKVQPIIKAVEFIKSKIKSPARGEARQRRQKSKTKVILFTPSGKQFDEKMAARLAKNFDNFIFICGRYEGVDERVKKILRPEEISIGPYVLSGGELPALVLTDAIARKVFGVLGKEESLEENRLGVGVPVYTRPEVFKYKGKKYRVPKELISGHHKDIKSWRLEHKKI